MGIFSKPKQQDAGAIVRAQEEAAKREREKLALEAAKSEAFADQQRQKTIQEAQAKRRLFSSGLAQKEDEEENRRKFLKGV